MNLIEWIREKIFKKSGNLQKINNPNDRRLTFITDDEAIRIEKVRECKVWYYGEASELLNYYTNQQVYGWAVNPIYNRNSINLFWGQSAREVNIKRVHSGIPRAATDTVSNIVGKPTINSEDPRLEDILKSNNFEHRLIHEIRPLALVEGDGCLKININKDLANYPLIEFYEAEDWEPIYKSSILFGLVFKTYYKDNKDRNYVLLETRSIVPEGCLIEYNLYRIGKNNDLTAVPYDTIPELAHFKDNNRLLINGVKKLFAVPVKYFYNPIYKNRGKPLYEGKITLFDTLDEIWSQAAQTNRVSTPVEYYDITLLERDKNGRPILPSKYNRQYIAKNGTVDGDGVNKEEGIITTQPDLNFDKYSMLANDVLNYILIGVLSPSTLGIDIAKKDNADAQREKEKQSIFTRNSIIDPETEILNELLNMCLMVQDYLDTGVMVDKDFNISITYDEFANPSFESELQILGPAWSQGQISTKQYLKMLWAGKLSEEELLAEEQYLEQNKQQDNIDLESLLNGNSDSKDLSEERPEEEATTENKE